MARKREILFFTDIQTDEQLETFLKQNVLLGELKIKNLSLQSKVSSFVISARCLSRDVWTVCKSTKYRGATKGKKLSKISL